MLNSSTLAQRHTIQLLGTSTPDYSFEASDNILQDASLSDSRSAPIGEAIQGKAPCPVPLLRCTREAGDACSGSHPQGQN